MDSDIPIVLSYRTKISKEYNTPDLSIVAIYSPVSLMSILAISVPNSNSLMTIMMVVIKPCLAKQLRGSQLMVILVEFADKTLKFLGDVKSGTVIRDENQKF